MKHLKKLLSFVVSPFALGLLVTAVTTYISWDYYQRLHSPELMEKSSISRFIQLIHEKMIDFRLRDRGPALGSPRVAVLAIDDRSIEEEGRWPWPRDKMARLVERSLASGAKAIAFDIIFSEPDTNSSLPTLTRLKRDLRNRGKLDDDTSALLQNEINKADMDFVFAETIKRNADSVVMGSYFDGYDTSLNIDPVLDLCLDTLFERTYESRYWKREAIEFSATDTELDKLAFPAQFKEHLKLYFTTLEATASANWFQSHPEKMDLITDVLRDLDVEIPVEVYPGLATLWLNNDKSTLLEVLEQIAPNLNSDAGVNLLIRQFGSAFGKKDTASLQTALRGAGVKYCHRFLTEDDDLISLENFRKQWADDEESAALFQEMSWASLWTQMNATQEGGSTPIESEIQRLVTEALPNSVENIYRWWVNIPVIGDVTRHSGYFNAVQDLDGSIRRSALFVRQGNSYSPSLSLKTFLLDQGYTAAATLGLEPGTQGSARTKRVQTLAIRDRSGRTVMTIPVDRRGRLMINYAGGRHMFPHISAADILSEHPTLRIHTQEKSDDGTWLPVERVVDKADFLKDKILVAGATSIGVYDLRVTPFEENYPGVETHANVLSNLLIENDRVMGRPVPNEAPGFLRTHPAEERLMWVILSGLGVALSALLSYFGSVAGLGITAVSLGAVYAIDKYVLFRSGIIITAFFPVLLISGNFVALTFYKYFTEERKKRELKGTFEKYVSPAIVAEVLSDPENIELGGKKMELTVMFSDVRGFTTISEKLDPRALSDLLNSYLTPMTNLVFANKGTLDKYMGDAIMAFWGAPIHFADHAHHACRCALQMIEKLKELQAAYRAKGLPEIDIGIGLNTGEMSVGNMGSDTVRSYTVMGDAVNLGSRLEGINKQYGTRIIISEFTHDAIKSKFTTREVDWVRVKGKAQPVRIYELISEGAADAKTQDLLKWFNDGFDQYHRREFSAAIESFTQALKVHSDDAVSQLYLERCENYLKSPPPEDWDGVFTMTSK